MTASLLPLSHCSSLVLCAQMRTLGYEWAFVRLLNRPLCRVSRLKHLPWKKPLIPFTNRKFNVFLWSIDSPLFRYHYHSIGTFLSTYVAQKINQGFCRSCCPYDNVASSRKLNYPPSKCVMISFQFKPSSVDFLWFSCGLSCCQTTWVIQQWDEHNGCHL